MMIVELAGVQLFAQEMWRQLAMHLHMLVSGPGLKSHPCVSFWGLAIGSMNRAGHS